jgi:predicted glycoside hydrolase/deacetylase ChbG (UPF0249 family)
MMGRGLIINADDFGIANFTPAIVTGFERGFVTSASLLVNRTGSASAAEIANSRDLPIGLHLNLTTGPPVASPGEVSSLLGTDGSFLGEKTLRHHLRANLIQYADIERECRAQLDWFGRMVRLPATHLDGHHHIHIETPVAAAVGPLMREYGIFRVRQPFEEERFFDHLEFSRKAWAAEVNVSTLASRPIFAGSGCRWPTDFLGYGLGWENCTLDRIKSRLSNVQEATAEYMVHVGRADDLRADDPAFRRHFEYDVLASPEFADLLSETGFRRISFADL